MIGEAVTITGETVVGAAGATFASGSAAKAGTPSVSAARRKERGREVFMRWIVFMDKDLGAPPSPAWLDGFGWDGMRARMGATLR